MAAQLQLPDFGLKLRSHGTGEEVFDPCRKLWVALTPEENVRQHFLNYLVHERQCPLGLVRTEHEIKLNGMSKRADIVVHDEHGQPLALVECKAPEVRIDQAAFDQAVRYNLVFKVHWLILTNGLKHYCYHLDPGTGEVKNRSLIPTWTDMRAANGRV
ncbi:MAG: type I restriction enzyme HsdR N-terminal domain-containing protein [Flavobacteriales bacterium]|nr:MAG: type I restriction enzyme HsdR N-terminal domain-containing protein [Flavobacteriales bacterium]